MTLVIKFKGWVIVLKPGYGPDYGPGCGPGPGRSVVQFTAPAPGGDTPIGAVRRTLRLDTITWRSHRVQEAPVPGRWPLKTNSPVLRVKCEPLRQGERQERGRGAEEMTQRPHFEGWHKVLGLRYLIRASAFDGRNDGRPTIGEAEVDVSLGRRQLTSALGR